MFNNHRITYAIADPFQVKLYGVTQAMINSLFNYVTQVIYIC